MSRVNILGVQVDCLDRDGILDRVFAWSQEPARRSVMYVNAHCLNTAQGDAQHRAILNQADLVYSDGISVVWASRWLGGCALNKVTGADWIYNFSARALQNQTRFYILAGRPGVARQACKNLLQAYPGLQIAGVSDGYFHEKSQAQVLAEIQTLAPHVVLVGMGTPHQEKWIETNRSEIRAPVVWAVGALFDFVAGVEPRVPVWMNALALEWLFRMLIDPLGKWQRYLVGNPLFLYRIMRQKLRQKLRQLARQLARQDRHS